MTSPLPWITDKRWQTLLDVCRSADAACAFGASRNPPKWTNRQVERVYDGRETSGPGAATTAPDPDESH